MSNLEEKVTSFIRAHDLFAGTDGIILAVSGGADSICLLHVMHALVSANSLRTPLVCVHINHQLRGDQSNDDQAFVVEQATKLGIPVAVKTVDVKTHAKRFRLSIETAGRELRLASLAEIAQRHHFQWMATGHQKNDNAETILQRLARGTGFRGLAGIRPWRQWNDLKLASPLLGCSREEINSYLQTKGIPWREDRSNRDCVHRRNFIRHRLLPTLQNQSNESLVEHLSSLAISSEKLYRKIEIYAQQVASESVVCTDRQAAIDAPVLANLPELVAVELIRQQLGELGCGERHITRRHYRDVLKLARSGTLRGKRILPQGFLACRQGGKFILQNPLEAPQHDNPDLTVELNIPGTNYFDRYRIEARIIEGSKRDTIKIKDDKSPFLEYLDLDRLVMPLGVRYRHHGDRFQPLGMSAEKKVGKFLTTAKVPEPKRRNVLVFHDRRSVLWLCPVRLGQPASITPETYRLLELEVTEEIK